MKPVKFDYARPGDVGAALKLIADDSLTVKIVAGSQSLGPMLNMRLVQPDLLVDITVIEELRSIDQRSDEIVLGACITHADIE
ncbi:FAD binding domain-containing protein, partial [Acinetobacter baumannii]